jgi:hypothetical protein
MAHKALTTMLLSNSYLFLPSTQGRPVTNRWNLWKIGGAIAWGNKICSSEKSVEFWVGCTKMKDQHNSNNNAKLKRGAKMWQCCWSQVLKRMKSEESDRSTSWSWEQRRCVTRDAACAAPKAKTCRPPNRTWTRTLFFVFFFCFVSFFFSFFPFVFSFFRHVDGRGHVQKVVGHGKETEPAKVWGDARLACCDLRADSWRSRKRCASRVGHHADCRTPHRGWIPATEKKSATEKFVGVWG